MRIGFVIYPGVTQLDFTGPLQFLGRMPGAQPLVIAKTNAPVTTDSVLTLQPTHSFAEVDALDIICVPGGFGVTDFVQDPESLSFVKQMSQSAQYITSVCTGALILGAAGLLQGRKATTHWAYTSLLPMLGAQYSEGRVVRDGNLYTGGGVTAGIDFALTLIRDLHGETVAARMQLGFEYDPAPPIKSGHPSVASAETVSATQAFYTSRLIETRNALETALSNRPPSP